MIVAGVAEVVDAFQIELGQMPALGFARRVLDCFRFRDIRERWPINSVYVLGLFLGIDLILAGACWIGIGLGLRGHQARRGLAPAA
jgi:hypothetical protein